MTAPTGKPTGKPTVQADNLAPRKMAKSGDLLTVKNIGKSILCLSKGSIKPGAKGKATVAEFSTLSKYLEKT